MQERQIGFRGTPEYRKWIQQQALDRGVKVQVLLERAVEAYLKPGPGSKSESKAHAGDLDINDLPSDAQKFVKLFVKLLRSDADNAMLKVIKTALESAPEEHRRAAPKAG